MKIFACRFAQLSALMQIQNLPKAPVRQKNLDFSSTLKLKVEEGNHEF
jgi:hypothetical protein